MPTLEFLSRQEEAAIRPPITKRGFESEFFRDIDLLFREMGKDDEEISIDSQNKIKSKLLRTGPCPGNARVYYKLTAAPMIPGSSEYIPTALGEKVDTDRRDLGQLFEQWVDDLNQAVNEWLDTRDDSVIESVDAPERLKEFYLNRLSEISDKVSETDIESSELKMDVQHDISSRYFHPAEPDGVWLPTSISGGVFESKLSLPPTPVDKYELAGYAAYLERAENIPVDYGVYLRLDEDLDHPVLDSFHIDDVFRGKIKENVEIFSSLVFISKAEGEWDDSIPVKNRLVEPEEPKYSRVCSDCLYLGNCHKSGKYHELVEEIYNDVSNLKLSGNHILPVVKAVANGEPNREDVVNEVMELFPGKEEKSVFRGMAVPTNRRLQLIRVGSEGQKIALSPNGKLIAQSSSPEAALNRVVTDYAVLGLGLTSNALNYIFQQTDAFSSDTYPELKKNFKRLQRQYLDYFEVELPQEDDKGGDLILAIYNQEEAAYLTDGSMRKELLDEALPDNQQLQYDYARWRIIKQMQEDGMNVSTWFVDEVVWREWNGDEAVIDLYEGSTLSDIRLMRAGTPYDGIEKVGQNS
ncbi:hypothetical protein N0B31_02680 [Salinirubellus salinus]|uniref:Uncharacterized protein n=1 Tax=Salinirubellus salinus TaxID=1364945 RepID=A0A9E7R486_9EURY|nr:hypothetical protein [Salinirubellus salinus]UWM55196.1 hypothetical protein N0B31_02680 [Salinirubellus salinus]